MNKTNNINNLSKEAIQCRALRHYWVGSTADEITINRKKGYWVTLRCGRGCGTERKFFLSLKGEYGASHFSYGDNYLLDHRATTEEQSEMKLLALVDLIAPDRDDENVVKFSSRKGAK